MIGMEVPHLEFSIKEDEIIEGAKRILAVFRPEWDLSSVKFKIFTDGITNKLLGCFHESQDSDVLLIRVYGNKTDLLIDRKSETRNFKLLNAAGLAPRLYATFDGGLVYEYVEGDVLTVNTCRVEGIASLVARTLADVHCVKTEEIANVEPALWRKLRQFLNLVPRSLENFIKHERLELLFKQQLNLEDEFAFLKKNLTVLRSPIVFCHNDLLLGNIVYNRDKNFVMFIDYEYADYNYQAFDIANHFNEYAGVETVNYDLFPSREYQSSWLRVYLERYHSNIEDRAEIEDGEVEVLLDTVRKFTLASHFLWGVWALIQAENSDIDFDYLNYAFIRFREYFSRKAEIFLC